MKNRIGYIDNIRVCSIFFVIYCHYVLISNDSFIGNLLMNIACFGVPCFFMCSGAILLNKQKLNIKKNIYKILQIYFVNIIWRLIYLILNNAINEVTILKIKDIFNYVFLFGNIEGVDIGHLWFINVFFAMSYFISSSLASVSYTTR